LFNLIKARQSKNLSQKQLAELVGVSRSTIAALEVKNSKSPTVENAKKIAEVLGVEWTQFFE